MLLQNIEAVAPSFGKKATWNYEGFQNGRHTIIVSFVDAIRQADGQIIERIKARSVDRRPYRLKSLTAAQKQDLANSLGNEFGVDWYEGAASRLRFAALTKLATQIRLAIPETFEIHNKIVDWNNRFSPTAIPAQALGLDSATQRIMRWTLKSRGRTDLFNKLGSPLMAAIQMDLLPGFFSAGYFAVYFQRTPFVPHETPEEILRLGEAMQRFWLSATALGLVLQPAFAVLAFAYYGRAGSNFTIRQPERVKAALLAAKADQAFRNPPAFFGRIGFPKGKLKSRSTRRELPELFDDELAKA